MRVGLSSEPDGAICVESPYDAMFVETLKARIPWDGRKWDAGRKRWLVSALYEPDLLRLLEQYGADVYDRREQRVVTNGGALTAPPPMPDELRIAFETLFLAYTAPLCVAIASYKALSRYWHPDVGGRMEDMQRANDAIDVIKRYLDPPEGAPDASLPF